MSVLLERTLLSIYTLGNQTMWWGVSVWIISHKTTRIIPYSYTQQYHGRGEGTKCHGSKYTAHIHNVPVQQFKVFTCRHFQYCLFWYIWQRRSYKNWSRLTLIFWTPQPNPQATHNQRSHNKPLSSNKSN